jgi:hypothetical protein
LSFKSKIVYAVFITLIHATCPTHLIFLQLNTVTVFVEDCPSKIW